MTALGAYNSTLHGLQNILFKLLAHPNNHHCVFLFPGDGGTWVVVHSPQQQQAADRGVGPAVLADPAPQAGPDATPFLWTRYRRQEQLPVSSQRESPEKVIQLGLFLS